MRQFGAIWSDLLGFPGTFWDGLFVVASNLIYIPGTQTTSIFEGQPPKTSKAFSNQSKGHLGSRYIYIYTHNF